MNLVKKVLKNNGFISNLFKFSIPTWINFIISFLAAFILTRVFSPSDYGIISIFISTTEFGMALMCLGMDSGALRFYYNPPNGDKNNIFMGKILFICLVITLILSFVICFFLPDYFSKLIFGMEEAVLTICLCLNISCSVIFRFIDISFRMEMQTQKYAFLNVTINLIRKASYILAIFISPDYLTAIQIQVLLLMFTATTYLFKNRKLFSVKGIIKRNNPFKGYFPFFRFSLLSAPSYFITYASSMCMLLVIRVLSGNETAGIYSASFFFVSALAVMRGGFATFWAPYMYQNYKVKQNEIKLVHDVWMLFCSFCFALLIVFRDVIYLLIGPEFVAGKTIISLIMLGSLLQASLETTIYGVYINKKVHITLLLNLIQFILSILLAVLLVPLLDLYGAAIAYLMSNVFYFVAGTICGQENYRSVDSLKRTFLVLALLLAESLLVYYIIDILNVILVVVIINIIILIIYRKTIKILIDYIQDNVKFH